ncbi:MAG: DUF835 domain-containing protein [Thermoplasmatota archaeon]
MEEEKKIEIYLKGYEEGKKEAWSNVKTLANRYEGWELKTRIESKLGTLYQDVDSKRVELRDDPGTLSFIDKVKEEPKETETGEDEVSEEKEDRYILDSLEAGDSCLIIESEPKKASGELKKAAEGGKDCLFITRMFPEKIVRTYDLPENIRYIYLSKSGYNSNSRDDIDVQTSSPGNLSKLSTKIGGFFKTIGGGVLLLTGLPFMFSYNDFNKIHKFLSWTKEKVHENNGNLIVSLPRTGFKEDYLLKLKGEFERVVEVD